jgi:hypothetical protein
VDAVAYVARAQKRGHVGHTPKVHLSRCTSRLMELREAEHPTLFLWSSLTRVEWIWKF